MRSATAADGRSVDEIQQEIHSSPDHQAIAQTKTQISGDI